MASKTQSGQQFSARSMNGIIEIDDGAGTLISGGIIQTNDINTGNLTSDFITANNLLEGDVNETITAKWTFSQAPYITTAPTDANDAVNKAYVDDNFVGLLGTQNIIGTKTFENAFMSTSYTPISAKQITTKEYVDAVGTPTIESVLQQGNDANGEAMTGLSNLTMNTGYTPTLDLEVSTKNYSDVFTGKIDATNNSFFTTIELFNPPFQLTGTTTIPVGIYTIQSLLTQIATSLASTFSATLPPSVVITEWTYDITTNKVSARLPSNSTIPELTHRIDPLLQLLGFQGSRSPWTTLSLFNNAPATPADHPQHLPYLKEYIDGNFVDLTTNQSVAGSKTFTDIPYLTNIRDNSLVNGTLQLYYNNTTGEIGKLLSVSPVIDLEYVLQQGNDANGEAMTGLSNLTMDTGYSPSTALQVATKDYVDSVVAGGGITENLLFDSNGNSRFQKITGATPPAPMYGGYNTAIGFETAYNQPNDIFFLRNTFLGYRAGYNYATGYAAATDCTFIGAFAGQQAGNNNPYAWNRTTCIGYRSYADKSDQIAIGDGTGETRVRGSLRVDGTSTFVAISTFNSQTNFLSQPYYKLSSISYALLSEYNAYTKTQTYTQTEVNNLLAPKATITQLQTRTPTYFSTWTYANQNTSFSTLQYWLNNLVAFSHSLPLPSNTGNSTFSIGEYVPAGTEDINQMSSTGFWTANVAGMYDIECVLCMYSSYQMELWIDIYRASTSSFSVEKYFRARHQVPVSGGSPYGIPFNYNSLIYLAQGDGIRVRGQASGAYSYGYVYTYYQLSYLRITRTTGY